MEALNILIVEDNSDLTYIEKNFIDEIAEEIFTVDTLEKALLLLFKRKKDIDIILLDLNLPDSYGLNTFFAIKKAAKFIPIIIVSGISVESLSIQAVSNGAQDYILKESMNKYVINKSIRYSIERHNIFMNLDTIVERKTAEVTKAADFAYQIARSVSWILEHDILDDEIDYLLKKFGSIIDSDRMLILKLVFDTEECSNVNGGILKNCNYSIEHMWSKSKKENVECTKEIGFPCYDTKEGVHWWHKALLERKTKSILIRDLVDKSSKVIKKYGSKSIICVPIYATDRTPWGLLVCEQHKYERIWTELEIRNLEILAPIISLVYEKNKRDSRILEMSKKADSVLVRLRKYNSEMSDINARLIESV